MDFVKRFNYGAYVLQIRELLEINEFQCFEENASVDSEMNCLTLDF